MILMSKQKQDINEFSEFYETVNEAVANQGTSCAMGDVTKLFNAGMSAEMATRILVQAGCAVPADEADAFIAKAVEHFKQGKKAKLKPAKKTMEIEDILDAIVMSVDAGDEALIEFLIDDARTTVPDAVPLLEKVLKMYRRDR